MTFFCFAAIFDPVSGASKSDEVDRIIGNIFTSYKKDIHPSTSRQDGAIEVGLSIIPLFIEVVSFINVFFMDAIIWKYQTSNSTLMYVLKCRKPNLQSWVRLS